MEDEDLAVYHFDSLGGENDLAGLLEEDSNSFNDETFGTFSADADPLGASLPTTVLVALASPRRTHTGC